MPVWAVAGLIAVPVAIAAFAFGSQSPSTVQVRPNAALLATYQSIESPDRASAPGTTMIAPMIVAPTLGAGLATTTVAPTPISLTVTAVATSKFYGDADPILKYATVGLVAGDTLSGLLARAPGANVGTYVITQGTLKATSKYSILFTSALFTINKAG